MLASGRIPQHRLPTPPLDDESALSHPWFRPGGMQVPDCDLYGEDSSQRLNADNIKAINGLLGTGTRQPTGPDFSEIARPSKEAAPAISRYSQLMASKFGSSSGSQPPAQAPQVGGLQASTYIPLQAIRDSVEQLGHQDNVIRREFAAPSYIQSIHAAMPSSHDKDQGRQFAQQPPQQQQTNPYPPPSIAIHPAAQTPWEQQPQSSASDVLADFRSMVANRLANVYSGYSTGLDPQSQLPQQPTAGFPVSFFAADKANDTQQQQPVYHFENSGSMPTAYWRPPVPEDNTVPVPKTPYEQLLEAKFGRATETAAAPSIEALTGGEVPPGFQEHVSSLRFAGQFSMSARDQSEMWKQTRQIMSSYGQPTTGADGINQWPTSMYGNAQQFAAQTPVKAAINVVPRGTMPPTPLLGLSPANSEGSTSAKNVYTAAYEAFAKTSAGKEAVQQMQQPNSNPPQQPTYQADFSRPTYSQYPPTPVTPQSQPHGLPQGGLSSNPYPTPQYSNHLQSASQPYFAPGSSSAPSQQAAPRSPMMAPSSPSAARFHDEVLSGFSQDSLALQASMQVPMWQLMGSRSPLPTTAANVVQASGSGSGSGDGGYGAGDMGDSGLPLGNFIGGDGYGGQDYGNGDGHGHDEHGNGNGNGDGHDQHGHPQDVPRKLVLACHFCRGRKLKCDGVRPTCAHCNKRGLECSYDAVVRRRGPGKRNKEDKEKGEGGSRKGSRKRNKTDDLENDPHKRLRTDDVNDLDLVDPALADLEPLRLAALASQDGYVYHDHEVHHDDVPVDPALLGAHLH